MKDFCVDLEIAKELKENGFPQNSYFVHDNEWHYPLKASESIEFHKSKISLSPLIYTKYSYNPSSAPTSDEILKELPAEVNGFNFRIERTETDFLVGYYEVGYEDEVRFGLVYDKKPSHALAKMWLYLKKGGYIK